LNLAPREPSLPLCCSTNTNPSSILDPGYFKQSAQQGRGSCSCWGVVACIACHSHRQHGAWAELKEEHDQTKNKEPQQRASEEPRESHATLLGILNLDRRW
jgi:hypothetical protein